MRYLESGWTNPAMNLALEQYAFDTLALDGDLFMLWRNHDAVIVGSHQNTAAEVNLTYAEQNGIEVVRRLSGGGAVFHDLGNLNFTFIVNEKSAEFLDIGQFSTQIVNALKSIGLQTELSGRNDITLGGAKFSGTAGYYRDGRFMHHGTLLFDTDFDKMTEVLRVSDDKIVSKGVSSVRDRVTNIRRHLRCDMTMSEFLTHIRTSTVGDTAVYSLTEMDIGAVDEICRERYANWEWNFGRSPGYGVVKKRFIPGFGSIRISLDIRNGEITAFASDGDYFGDNSYTDVASALIGAKHEKSALRAALSGVVLSKYYRNLGEDEFISLILE